MYIFILMQDKYEGDRECEDEHGHEYKTYLKEKKNYVKLSDIGLVQCQNRLRYHIVSQPIL
jgi:hypothetical protein